jgi:hypothetical protein
MANRPHTHGANCSLILTMQTNLPINSNLFPSSATRVGGWNLLGAISALQRTPHVTGTPLPDLGPAVHDISPILEDQLVLELEHRVPVTKIIKVLPRREVFQLATPLDQHLSNTTGQARVQHLGRLRHHRAVKDGGSSGGNSGGATTNFFSTPVWKMSWRRASCGSASRTTTSLIRSVTW